MGACARVGVRACTAACREARRLCKCDPRPWDWRAILWAMPFKREIHPPVSKRVKARTYARGTCEKGGDP
eukprot:2758075-Pleurochrysis_carterae.AAC.1